MLTFPIEWRRNTPTKTSGPELANALKHRNSKLDTFIDEGIYTTVNLPPYASIDSVAMIRGAEPQVAIAVMANDHDTNNHSLHLAAFDTETSNGATVHQDGLTLIYKPSADFEGIDFFTYLLKDASGQTATGVVTVEVRAPKVMTEAE